MVEGAARLALHARDLAVLVLVVGDQRGEVAVVERLLLLLLDERPDRVEHVALREAQPPVLADLLDDCRQVLQHEILERQLRRALLDAHLLEALLLARLVADLGLALFRPVGGDELDRLPDGAEAGRVSREAALAAIEELGPRADQVRQQDDRLVVAAVVGAELVAEPERIAGVRAPATS